MFAGAQAAFRHIPNVDAIRIASDGEWPSNLSKPFAPCAFLGGNAGFDLLDRVFGNIL